MHRFIEKLNNVLIAIAAAVLAMIMFLTAVDVFMRYLFNSPVSGSFELVEFMMAILVPFGIVYCGMQKAHVAVDLVHEKLSKRLQALLDVITTSLTLIFMGLIGWKSIEYIFEVKSTGLTSAVLHIPSWPFILPVAIGMAAFMLVSIVHLIDFIKKVKNS